MGGTLLNENCFKFLIDQARTKNNPHPNSRRLKVAVVVVGITLRLIVGSGSGDGGYGRVRGGGLLNEKCFDYAKHIASAHVLLQYDTKVDAPAITTYDDHSMQ